MEPRDPDVGPPTIEKANGSPSASPPDNVIEAEPSSSTVVVTALAVGAVLTLIVNVWATLVSTPPFVVPPLSWIFTVTLATPDLPGAGVKLRSPDAETAGCVENSVDASFVTM